MWFYGCIRGFYRRASDSQRPTTLGEVGILSIDRKVTPLETRVARSRLVGGNQSVYEVSIDSFHFIDSRSPVWSTTIPDQLIPHLMIISKSEHFGPKLRSRRFYSRSLSVIESLSALMIRVPPLLENFGANSITSESVDIKCLFKMSVVSFISNTNFH